MLGNKKKTNWGQVLGAVAALKVLPFKKTLLGIAAGAAAVYVIRRLRGASAQCADACGG